MALQSFVGSFNTGTGAATTTVVVTGVGFVPKSIIFWWSGRSESTDTIGRASHVRGFGVANSATDRRAIVNKVVDAAANADTQRAHDNAACILSVSVAAAIDGQIDLQSMDADGFTLVVDDAMPLDLRVNFMALGGDSLTNVQSGQFQAATVTGNQDITGVGFQPDFVMVFGIEYATAPPSATGYAPFLIGAAVSSSQQGILVTASEDTVSTMDTFSYCTDDEFIANSSAEDTSIETRADFVSFLSDGFRINWIEIIAGARYHHYLALKGGNYVVGNLLTQTDTVTDIVESGFGFQPSGAMFFSAGVAKSTNDVSSNNDRVSIGAFSGVSTRGAQGTLDEYNLTDSEVTTAIEFDEVYVNIKTDSTIDGLMDVKSIDSDGFTMIMDDADPAQAFVWYIAFGAAAAAGGVIPQAMASYRRRRLINV